MSVSRKDDRHNGKLYDEIAQRLNGALAKDAGNTEGSGDADTTSERPKPAFVITGDLRDQPRKRREQ